LSRRGEKKKNGVKTTGKKIGIDDFKNLYKELMPGTVFGVI